MLYSEINSQVLFVIYSYPNFSVGHVPLTFYSFKVQYIDIFSKFIDKF